MQIYLVGGAVRDKLLGLPVTEKDWVVVGATPQQMLALGYQPVGKDFPVFLHPHTHEEYALARTERKVEKGYKGFIFHTTPDVSLQEDLQRRDLTINAMAESLDGTLIDPYGGQRDLKDKILRHVSPAFQEDPVRILRLARFTARFPDFTIHPDTTKLACQMVHQGEVNALVAERVWQELDRALHNPKPTRFFDTLTDCQALAVLFPEMAVIKTGFIALHRATTLSASGPVRLAALLHELTVPAIQHLAQRYRMPTEYVDLLLLVVQNNTAYLNIAQTDAPALLSLILTVDALRRPQRFQHLLTACSACYPEVPAVYHTLLLKALHTIKSVDTVPLQKKNLTGLAFAKALHELRLAAIQELLLRL